MNFVQALCGCACGSLGLLLLVGASPLPDGTTGDSGAPLTAAAPDRPDVAAPPAAVPPSAIPPEAVPAPAAPGADGIDTCPADQACVDRYLWSLYSRTPKVDTVGIPERKTVSVTHKGKTKTVTKTETRLADEDFGWKDPKAAELTGKSLIDYVIGGMDPGFRGTLYHAMRVLDDAGFQPGIMCAFRDDYRQSIATGLKAQNDRSFHGGSFRGGYGHGLAADIVSVRGETRTDRLASTSLMWEFIDAHQNELGIGRPYGDRDPPHVGPLDGEEYTTRHHKSNAVAQGGKSNRNKSAARNAKHNADSSGSSTKTQTGASAKSSTKTAGTKTGGNKTAGNKTGGGKTGSMETKSGSKPGNRTGIKAGSAGRRTAGKDSGGRDHPARDTRGDDRRGALAVRDVTGRERPRPKSRTRAI